MKYILLLLLILFNITTSISFAQSINLQNPLHSKPNVIGFSFLGMHVGHFIENGTFEINAEAFQDLPALQTKHSLSHSGTSTITEKGVRLKLRSYNEPYTGIFYGLGLQISSEQWQFSPDDSNNGYSKNSNQGIAVHPLIEIGYRFSNWISPLSISPFVGIGYHYSAYKIQSNQKSFKNGVDYHAGFNLSLSF
ncbi:hypothetical protein DID75_01535 [Candidatus Marinamargulisbacteria bacterium SCGC AG-410-N11]|nr:hypothetical protein DID75_01535 [Candidatus Marinamargulisbacteria bacterium SCGC AG-410-N11]